MNEKNNGGPAFPVADRLNFGPEVNQGMTLRDYFAAKAMAGMLAGSDNTDFDDEALRRSDYPAYCDLFAEGAYSMADAMLKARVNTNA